MQFLVVLLIIFTPCEEIEDLDRVELTNIQDMKLLYTSGTEVIPRESYLKEIYLEGN